MQGTQDTLGTEQGTLRLRLEIWQVVPTSFCRATSRKEARISFFHLWHIELSMLIIVSMLSILFVEDERS